jgi:hypothetical protein
VSRSDSLAGVVAPNVRGADIVSEPTSSVEVA